MRSLLVSLAFALTACSGTRSPGPLGQPLDLKEYLPEALKTGVPDTAFHHRLKVGPDSALIEVTWTPFVNGRNRLLGEVRAQLLEPVKYDSITIGEIGSLQNFGTKSEAVESAGMKIRWFKTWWRRRSSGFTDFEFDAKGRRMVTPERR